jgi:hypothetical protein
VGGGEGGVGVDEFLREGGEEEGEEKGRHKKKVTSRRKKTAPHGDGRTGIMQ